MIIREGKANSRLEVGQSFMTYFTNAQDFVKCTKDLPQLISNDWAGRVADNTERRPGDWTGIIANNTGKCLGNGYIFEKLSLAPRISNNIGKRTDEICAFEKLNLAQRIFTNTVKRTDEGYVFVIETENVTLGDLRVSNLPNSMGKTAVEWVIRDRQQSPEIELSRAKEYIEFHSEQAELLGQEVTSKNPTYPPIFEVVPSRNMTVLNIADAVATYLTNLFAADVSQADRDDIVYVLYQSCKDAYEEGGCGQVGPVLAVEFLALLWSIVCSHLELLLPKRKIAP